ncbi:Expansin B2 BETA 1.4 [Tripterygium wilfordii]|uniref:Expansin B2 BETA 1.4 n=1 Tax=Tripterygium wilfordii TaxID=458696 RepID=A0A7J7CCN7_TRIWF|nr:Expansin B2 BETA 1.4 [Tripterygium wilfordii]
MAQLSLIALAIMIISLNVSINAQFHSTPNFAQAGATWYGPPEGAGSEGGACGYGGAVSKPPYYSMISAACSGKPVTVVITDECPGCTSEAVHFDLSGHAFGTMALPGQAQQLRNAGVLQIQYQRVACNWRGTKVTFVVDKGANPYSFETLAEYENGEGEVGFAELKQAGATAWQPMHPRPGSATWVIDSGSPLRAPYSIRLTAPDSKRTIEATNVIPYNWQAGQTYVSNINF